MLAIDHVYGNSRKERKKNGAGSGFYRWLKRNNYPTGYQVLCHNCNYKKQQEIYDGGIEHAISRP